MYNYVIFNQTSQGAQVYIDASLAVSADASGNVFIHRGNLSVNGNASVGGDISVVGGVSVTEGVAITGGFGCNGASVQTAIALPSAATDDGTTMALANAIRSALISVGICS